MKQILLAFILLLFAGCADVTPISDADKEKPIEFTQHLNGKIQNEIFSSTKAWIAETFILGKATVEDENRNAGRIAIKARTPYTCETKCDDMILFALRMDIKNGELKLTFTDVRIFSASANNGQGKEAPITLQRELNVVKSDFRRLSESLQAAIMDEKANSDFR